jgi:hypothetical protein
MDLSITAVNIAQKKFPDIIFRTCDLNNVDDVIQSMHEPVVDLIVICETLSYLKNWEKLLEQLSCHCRYIIISLFIPDNPIGFVKSSKDLIEEISKKYRIIEIVSTAKSKKCVVFAEGQ